MSFVLELAITILFLGVAICLFLIWRNSHHLDRHRTWANRTVVLTTLAVVATEVMVRINGGSHLTILNIFHLGCAFLFATLLFGLRMKFTGHWHRWYHRVGGYSCFVLYAFAFSTGMYLLWLRQ